MFALYLFGQVLFVLNILIIYGISPINADILTNFDDKKDVKYSLFGFENQIESEKFPNWIYDGKVSASPISFDPPNLDFPETPIGQPRWEHVKIVNKEETSIIKLLSISSNTVDFHCSFFKEEIIMDGGNSSFDIVFLSRKLGEVQSTLFIYTSKGTFHYKVTAIGSPSQYRLRSFSKARIPLNSSFSSPIYFYNPFNYPIQILEMYTSGGDAHLELPNNGKQASKVFWTVPPYETRTLMKVKFLGRKVGNFTSYIRIRTNTTENTLGFVIPLQIEISDKLSLYCINDILYFGILRTLDIPKVLKILVVNSAKESIRLRNVSLSKPNDAVNIDFHQINIPPGIYQQVQAATITFSAFKATSESDYNGYVIIDTFQNQTLKVPYSADIIHGSLVYDANNTKFFSGSVVGKTEIRQISITNTFDFTVAIYSISLITKPNSYFKISNVTLPIFIKKQKTEKSIEIKFSVNEYVSQLIMQLAIFSNVSLFVIPLFVYDGKLTIISHRPEIFKGYLDFGTLGLNIESNLDFTIKNENPIEVTLFSMSTNWYLSSVLLIGIEKGNNTLLHKNYSYQSMINFTPLILKPYHFVVFRLKVLTPDTKGVFASEILIATSYENISIPYYLRTTDGVISNINPLILKHCFPSKLSKLLLTLNSSFQSYIELTSVNFIPNDTRLDFDPKSGRKLPILINPIESTNVGYMTFFPDNKCIDPLSNDFIDSEKSTSNLAQGVNIQYRILSEVNGKVPCYVGFNICTKLGHQWLNSVDMNSKTYDIDYFVYKRLNQQWEYIKSTDNHIFNVTMQMDTSNIKGFLYNVQIQLIWPSLLSSSKLVKFPLTQIGNSSYKDIYLENPSDKSVLIQLIFISQYSDPDSLLELLGISGKDINIKNAEVFSLHPKNIIGDKYVYNESIKENNKLKKMFLFSPHNESLMVYLLSRNKQRIRIYFNPIEEYFGLKLSTYILLRNNLTGIEVLRLEGEGAYGELSFQGGQFPEETSILNFDLTEKHLKSCDSQSKGLLPSFTVRRPFVIKNIGKIPVYILGFQFGPVLNLYENPDQTINDSYLMSSNVIDNLKPEQETNGESLWCAGYGFEILECYEHRLDVNETLKLEIVFTPDFSLHKVLQQLQIHTSLSDKPFNITVQATLPAHMLHRCSQALARPDSEVLIWYMAIVVLSVVSVAAIIMSYYEADRIFTSNVIYRHLSSVAVGHHLSNERMCDFRALVSKNSPFINTTNQFNTQHKTSSVQDYLSVYNRCSLDTNTIKRLNVCKKMDDKPLNNLIEKPFTQSFCGRNISDDLINSECNVNSLVANIIHQYKKKKKRGLFSSLIQWFLRLFNQISNQNSTLKPKLDNNYMLNYKNEILPVNTLPIKSDESKNEKNITSHFKIKEGILSTSVTQTNTSSNNNSNHSSHSKKLKNRSSCIIPINTSKVMNKQNDQTVATLNFAPIDIPVLDMHKCKKNINNRKLKKNTFIVNEEIKIKSSLRTDDSISISTDSSTDEKIKEFDGNKLPRINGPKYLKSKQEIKILDSPSLEEYNEQIIKLNLFSEPDYHKSYDYNIETSKDSVEFNLSFNNKNDIKSERNITGIVNSKNLKHNFRSNDPNHRNNSENEVTQNEVNSEINNYQNQINSKSYNIYNSDNSNKEIDKEYEIKDDYWSDECILWENENVMHVSSDDFSLLSSKTELFSNIVGQNDANTIQINTDEKPGLNLKTNIENWLSSTNTLFNNSMGKFEQQNDGTNNICSKNYSHINFQHDHNIHFNRVQNDDHQQLSMFHHYYKPSDNFGSNTVHTKLCNNNIYNQDITNFMSLELPGIAHGRKQSLLDYERRLQKETTECERISNISTLPLYSNDNFSSSVDKYWEMNNVNNDKIWNEEILNQRSNTLENSLWPTEKCWNQIEPGSQHDSLARTLLPIGLLSNDNTNGMFSTSHDDLWKFKSNDNINKQDNIYDMDSSVER